MQSDSGFLGTGLPGWLFAVIVAASTVVFIFLGGPIWASSPSATHVVRIAVSYLLVIPTVAVALMAFRRLSIVRLVTAVFLLWSAKLVVAASLYLFTAPGTANRYEPAQAHLPRTRRVAGADGGQHYRAASGEYASGTLRGQILAAGRPLPGAVVYLVDPAPGRIAGPAREIDMVLAGGRYDSTTYVASTQDTLRATNRDSSLHTVHLYRGDQSFRNVPVPTSNESRTIATPPPGSYTLRCDNHPNERGELLVVDHPYVTRADAGAFFAFDAVPTGDIELVVVAANVDPMARQSVNVKRGQTTEIAIEVGTK